MSHFHAARAALGVSYTDLIASPRVLACFANRQLLVYNDCMSHNHPPREILADDATEGVSLLLRLRLPWLLVGLVAGGFATVLVSRFEVLLEQHVSLAFFMPIIVYMGGAVGTQTETIFVRNMARGRISLHTYLLKEIALGILIGLVSGVLFGGFAFAWIRDFELAVTVGLAMAGTAAVAPVTALIVPALIRREHKDPALGAGPFVTIIQDILSIVIYFIVATAILLR